MADKDFLFLHLRDLPYFRAMVRSVESAFFYGLRLPSPVLDLGCGDGHFASVTFPEGIDIGLDPAYTALREARRYGVYRLRVTGVGLRLPFEDGCFASSISNSVLEHIIDVDGVLDELARVLKPGAPFYFSVPNPRYLSELSLPHVLGEAYREWFRRVTRVHHADHVPTWQARLEAAGFRMEDWWHYFSPSAMRVLEWGHYFGLPSLLSKKISGRWIIVPDRWNLWLTEKILRRVCSPKKSDDGVFTFFSARRR